VKLQAITTRLGAGSEASVTASLISSLASTNVPAPTGSVQFLDAINGGEARPIGTPQVVTIGNGGSLIATLASTLPKGSHLITAVYSGDSNWKTAVSAPVFIFVSNNRE
jgi:hypothetical protein